MIQDFDNKVQTAWTGLSNCNTQVNFTLTYDSSINKTFCALNSFGIKLNEGYFEKIVLIGFGFILFFVVN